MLTELEISFVLIAPYVGNKGEIIPEFSLEITQFDFTKRGGRDEA